MTDLTITRLDPDRFRRTPWKNGGGVTIDIADAYRPGAEPGSWSGMTWRFGRTTIAEGAPFSDLSGYDRILCVVAGRGLRLDGQDGTVIDVGEPFRPVRFSGDWAVTSALAAGPVEVVNLIGDRRHVVLDLVCLEEGSGLLVPAGDCILYAPGAAVRLAVGGEDVHLPTDHAARLTVRDELRIDAAAGRPVVAIITPRDGVSPRPASASEA